MHGISARYLRPVADIAKLHTRIRHKIERIDEGKRTPVYIGKFVRIDATLLRVYVPSAASGEGAEAASSVICTILLEGSLRLQNALPCPLMVTFAPGWGLQEPDTAES